MWSDPQKCPEKKIGIFRDIFQFESMGNQRCGIDPACFDEGEDFGAITAVHAAGFEGQVFAVHLRQGHHEDPESPA